MKKIKIIKWILMVSISVFIGACTINNKLSSGVTKSLVASDHFRDGKFHNSNISKEHTFGHMMGILKRYMVEKRIDSRPKKPLPIKILSRAQLEALDNDNLYLIKLGHSSILLKVYGKYWLIDPVFSDRASPFGFIGPKRFQPTPIRLKDLPPIEKVLISHNHYDHLDKAVIKRLATKAKQFLVPLGIENNLKIWGIDPKKIKSFDWWQEYQSEQALLVFTPSQHFSGRSMSDRNLTLWGSWVIKTAKQSIYYSGDSGYFSGFKKIGKKYGPFDLTLIETGAYNRDWADIHLLPEESVQAHIDLRGKTMLPVHNSTFDLSFHPWYEPLERVNVEAQKRNVTLTTPIVGEVFTATQKVATNLWWKNRLPK